MVNTGKQCLKSSVVVIAIVLLIAIMTLPVLAGGVLVVDQADLFTSTEAAQLTQDVTALGSTFQMDIIIVTTDDAGGKSAREYADDYFDNNGYGVGPDRDGILFLIDMDNREAYISTSGSSIRYLTDQRIEAVLDAVFAGGLSDGNYYGAAQAFIKATAGYLQAGIPSDQYNEVESQPNRLTALDGILGTVVSVVSGLGFWASIRKKYKGKPRPGYFDFRGNSLISLGITQDNLIDTRVTTRIRPVQPVATGSRSAGGRSTIHRSGGGGFHGGGGRKF
jgi:uncharacterized protein